MPLVTERKSAVQLSSASALADTAWPKTIPDKTRIDSLERREVFIGASLEPGTNLIASASITLAEPPVEQKLLFRGAPAQS
jgi:hypothetical protein